MSSAVRKEVPSAGQFIGVDDNGGYAWPCWHALTQHSARDPMGSLDGTRDVQLIANQKVHRTLYCASQYVVVIGIL